MKTLLIYLLLALPVAALDEGALLRAIAEVETGNRHVRGRAGEMGPHQVGPAARADNGNAQRHLRWMQRTLREAGLAPTPYLLALAWNAGCERVIQDREQARHRNYARRVMNLYGEYTATAQRGER